MKRRRRASAHVMAELREMVSGDVLREILDITDAGEVLLTQVTSKGATNEPHSDKRDVWTNVTEPLEYDRPHKPRLHHPAGIVFRAPKKNETGILLRPKSASGRNAPGFALFLPDGGDGSANLLPSWWGDNDCGLFAPKGETLHVEAADKDVIVKAGGATIQVFGATGKIEITNKAGDKLTLDSGSIKAAPGGTTMLDIEAGGVTLGDNPAATPVLTVGSVDSMGVPVTNSPANTGLVKAG